VPVENGFIIVIVLALETFAEFRKRPGLTSGCLRNQPSEPPGPTPSPPARCSAAASRYKIP